MRVLMPVLGFGFLVALMAGSCLEPRDRRQEHSAPGRRSDLTARLEARFERGLSGGLADTAGPHSATAVSA